MHNKCPEFLTPPSPLSTQKAKRKKRKKKEGEFFG